MSSVLPVLLLWLWLAIMGFLLARTVLRSGNPWLVLGSALPVAMLALLGTTFPLARLLGHPRGWVLAVLALFTATVVMYVKREQLIDRPLDDPGFSPVQFGCFMTLLSLASLVMHTREVLGPEDDYWIHFPLISLLARGEFPPPNPFFYDLSLHGHFGRDYLIAVLSWLAGGGAALLSTTWIFNHSLQVSAFLLAFGLGKREGGMAGGFLMSSFLFFGISVGSRVGLIDTYDNNNLLVYVLLLLFVALETTPESWWPSDLFLALGLGLYGIVYETHMLLLLMVLWGGPLLWRREPGPWSVKAWRRPLGLSLVALLVAAALGGPIQDLALRAMGRKTDQVHHAATYQEQRVQISFPKQHLFQILLGPEGYRRYSYVYQGKAFSGLRSERSEAGKDARQDFSYAYVWSKEVLMMHWLALYLGLPAGLWLLRRGGREGSMLWLFGLASFLVPALVDFGPVHEREYFRWEFAAGFGFAGALAVVLSRLWQLPGRLHKVAVVLLAIAVTIGGERKINRTFIDIEKLPEARRALATSPLYPSPSEWILGSQELRMDEQLLAAALELQELSQPDDRMLTDLDARSHWDIFRESTVCGLAGLRSVGHVSPPPWMPDGIAPFFRTAGWNTLWQTGDLRVLPSLRARWLLTHQEEHRQMLREQAGDQLKEVSEFGPVSLWRYQGPLTPLVQPPSPQARLVGVEREPEPALQSETVQPVTLWLQGVSGSVEISLRWVPQPGTDPGGPVEPLTLRETLPEQAEPVAFRHYLVPPLVEGDYTLEVLLNGAPLPLKEGDLQEKLQVHFAWTEQARQARVLSLEQDTLRLSTEGSALAPPLTVGLRLFRLDENRYNQPFGFEARGVWQGDSLIQLVPQGDFMFPVPEGQRAELFLLDRSGREVPLALSQP
jgi:hypothetical protein